MITVVSYWESSQMDQELEWRMWRQLRGAFSSVEEMRFKFVPVIPKMSNVAIEQYETMQEALESCVGAKVFLESTATQTVSNIPRGEDIVLILGNTEFNNTQFVGPNDLSLKIVTPGGAELYGINAAAIALAYIIGQ